MPYGCSVLMYIAEHFAIGCQVASDGGRGSSARLASWGLGNSSIFCVSSMYKALVAAALCAFVAHAKLEQFTQDSFDKLVKESTWVIDFASSSPSKARKTELETVADALQGTGIRVGYVDLSKEKTCGNGKPGLKVYGPDKSAKPVAIAGRFDIGNVLTKVFGEIERVVNARVGKSSKKEEKKSSKKSKKAKGWKAN
mmetsp:Transcript_32787/g.52317  ORF Transcript_32787/g.52317 Transcript_32787/m.52317 type:complete len:197 (+) Transcript_32787:88-678(+)